MLMFILDIFLIMLGYLCLVLLQLIPELKIIYLDWIASFFFIAPLVITIYRIMISDSATQVDKLPKWKHLVNYLRRDNRVIPLKGERAYPGESFIDIPQLGLMEYLGKDCVYSWGDKKTVFGLENINFTPDPRYGNFTHTLWMLGFTNSDEVIQILNGENPELRQKIYDNMVNWETSVQKLTRELKTYKGKVIDFKKDIDIKHKEAEEFLKHWGK